MKIPDGPNGYPTASPTMLRRYGSAGFLLAEGEDARGCPRLFRKQYVEHAVPSPKSFELMFGSLMHSVLERMETTDGLPDEILNEAFVDYPTLGPEALEEARDDLHRYMERGATPSDMYGLISVERELTALLYVDEVHGPIYLRAILDWIGIDLEEEGVVHVVDYKTNRARSSYADVRRDLQMRIQDWVTHQCSQEIVGRHQIQVVVHLDEIKHNNGDIAVRYTDGEREALHAYLVAVVKHILRDEVGKPRLNPGCAYCPVKASCSAYQALPETAQKVLDLRPDAAETDDDTLIAWRDKAWGVRTLLDKACKEVYAGLMRKAETNGGLVLDKYEYRIDTDWTNKVDMRRLHARLQDQFYDVVTVTKSALERLVKEWPASDAAEVLALVERTPDGNKMVKKAKK